MLVTATDTTKWGHGHHLREWVQSTEQAPTAVKGQADEPSETEMTLPRLYGRDRQWHQETIATTVNRVA